jgi:hypothetical protein
VWLSQDQANPIQPGLQKVDDQVECRYSDHDLNPAIVHLPVMIGAKHHDIRIRK